MVLKECGPFGDMLFAFCITWICIIDRLLFNFTQFPIFCMTDGMGNVMESVRVCVHRSVQIYKEKDRGIRINNNDNR